MKPAKRAQMIWTADMRFYFKPIPGLTIVTLISLAILIALGTWQYQRLQWKTALLAEIDIAAEAPPIGSFTDIQRLLDDGKPVDFRRFGSDGNAQGTPFFLVFKPEQGRINWRVFSPVTQGGVTAFAALDLIQDQDRDGLEAGPEGPLPLVGYVRAYRVKPRGAARSSPEKNRWFGFNPIPDTYDWADQVPGYVDMRYYIDVVDGAEDAAALPVRKPDIRNNHFDYMLTWYGLAITLLVIYFIFHAKQGRLGRR